MSANIVRRIAQDLSHSEAQVRDVATLLDEGATVPFIARYRKERTGSLDEVQVAAIRDRRRELENLEKRRGVIVSSLESRGLFTGELRSRVLSAETASELEDAYLPYRPKRRTRATMARERGLEPLADALFAQDHGLDPIAAAAEFVSPEKGVADAEAALAGARDIIAETVNESADARSAVRALFEHSSVISSNLIEGKEEEGATYRGYFDWQEPVRKAPSHRIHAALRAEREGVVRLSVRPDVTQATALLCERFVRGSHSSARQVREAVEDSYRRLMRPSLETELRASLKRRADDEAVRVFAANLKELLMAPPLGERRVLAIDPGYRTGCKVVCLDAQGRLLHDDLVYAAGSESQRSAARGRLAELVEEYEIQAIAIGNGTASRETEGLVRSLDLPDDVPVVMVNESGASVYSASETAREELPDYDVTVRGAASIGRRLQDPLAELVKIDPRSIGVGQYQHDVDQQLLRRTLDEVVERCVNAVGVEVNTASVSLLSRVSGIGKSLAESIVKARDESGPFASREELKKVRRLGPKAFEQAAGFLRIRGGAHPLDASAVHPESYHVVRRMANDVGCTVAELLRSPDRRAEIEVERYVTAEIGLPTLSDIMDELARPGRDPRQQFEPFSFSNEIQELDDVRPGMTLPGIVTNVVDFGAFVDLGVHQDGLVHVSEMAEHYVSRPSDVVKVGQRVLVRVLDVDLDRRRISLSLRL